MRLGDLVTWRGRLYRLCGFDPMGVEGPCAYLEDPDTLEVVRVPAEEVEEAAG